MGVDHTRDKDAWIELHVCLTIDIVVATDGGYRAIGVNIDDDISL